MYEVPESAVRRWIEEGRSIHSAFCYGTEDIVEDFEYCSSNTCETCALANREGHFPTKEEVIQQLKDYNVVIVKD